MNGVRACLFLAYIFIIAGGAQLNIIWILLMDSKLGSLGALHAIFGLKMAKEKNCARKENRINRFPASSLAPGFAALRNDGEDLEPQERWQLLRAIATTTALWLV